MLNVLLKFRDDIPSSKYFKVKKIRARGKSGVMHYLCSEWVYMADGSWTTIVSVDREVSPCLARMVKKFIVYGLVPAETRRVTGEYQLRSARGTITKTRWQNSHWYDLRIEGRSLKTIKDLVKKFLEGNIQPRKSYEKPSPLWPGSPSVN